MTRAILARATPKILLADGTKWRRPSDRIASFEVDPQPSSGLISAASSQEIDSPSLREIEYRCSLNNKNRLCSASEM
jgi:hypothetical protein